MKELEEFLAKHRKNKEKSMSFSSYLFKLMEIHGLEKTSEVYLGAGITKQAWSSIVSGKHQPSLSTCIKLALALHLNNHECKYLLKKAGYTLSSASEFSLIIRFCIENGIYDFIKVQELLSSYGYNDFFD